MLGEAEHAEIVDEHLGRMEQQGPPSDLVADFALAIPSLVICELLGVPYEGRGAFQHRAAKIIDFTLPDAERRQVGDDSRAYMWELVDRHRSNPGEDLLSRLIVRHASSGGPDDLSDDELIGVGNLLLVAGHETTSTMLAVEELLRYLSVVHTALPRLVTSEVAIRGDSGCGGRPRRGLGTGSQPRSRPGQSRRHVGRTPDPNQARRVRARGSPLPRTGSRRSSRV